jgi:regulator of sigma E protease
VVRYYQGLKKILGSSFSTIRESVSGPIGIAQQAYSAASHDFLYFIFMFAVFNIILAVTNLLPLPVLDGGHILFSTIEAIIRRPLPARFMLLVYNVFTFLIIGLALLITFNDVIMNWWRVPFVGKH